MSRNLTSLPTIALALLFALAGPAAAQQALQYRFEPGEELVYERQVLVTALGASHPLNRITDEVQVWCLQRDSGATLILLVLTRQVDGRAEPARAVLLYVDESGRRRLPAETVSRLGAVDPALDLLPMLPLPVQSLATWSTPSDLFERQWRCVGAAPDNSRQGHLRIDFLVEDTSGVADVLGQSRVGRFWFDPVAGYVSRFEAEEQDAGAQTQTRVVAVLRQVPRNSAEWAARRTDEAQRLLRTLRHEDRLLADIVLRPAELPHTLQQLDRLWTTFASDVDARAGTPFAMVADARRQQLRADADTLRARAALGQRWLNTPARTWSLQDPAGQTRTSESTRRGVVIECFWSSESIWGLRVLHPLSRWRRTPGDPSVPLLCYNMDYNLAVAQRAVARCGAGLAQILGGPLQDVEELPEFPVVRVVDQHGIIRGVWIGWDPNYAAARELARQLAVEAGR